MAGVMKKSLVKIVFVTIFTVAVSLVAGSAFAAMDINSASQKELESLPGVGPAIAKKIVAGRPYGSVDELSKAGLSKKAIDKLRPMVTVGSAPASASAAAPKASAASEESKVKARAGSAASKLVPGQKVNLNTATKDQLIALPGIGPAKAQAIIDARPYKSTEDVMKVKGIKQGLYNKMKDYITVQ